MYTQADISSRMNSRIQNKIGMLVDDVTTVNAGVRNMNKKLLMESRIRKGMLSPSLITGRYDYVLPTDFNGRAIIDIPATGARKNGNLEIVSPVEFETRPRFGTIAFDRYDGKKIIKVYGSDQSVSMILSSLQSLTLDGGTWVLSGDATNVRVDDDNYPYTNPVIAFDIAATGLTEAGIKNTALTSADFSKYVNSDSFAVLNTYLNTNITVSSITLKFGSDISNYYSCTVTAQFDGKAFVSGDNKLYFTSFSKTGSPDPTAIDYCEIVLGIASGHASALNFAFSNLQFQRGVPTPIIYYTNYNWVGIDGTYKVDATASTDYSLADVDEFDMHVDACVIEAMRELAYPENIIVNEETRLDNSIKAYQLDNPSDVLTYTTIYQDFTGDGMHINNVDQTRSFTN